MDVEVSLAEEARLDPEVVPSARSGCTRLGEASAVLVTGATGFLGAHLLDELLRSTDRHTKFYCLARPKGAQGDQPDGRVIEALTFYGLPGRTLRERIVTVTGDLAQPRFGLGDEEYQRLVEGIDLIFHCAAAVNLLYSYSTLKPHTVGGSTEVIKFACHAKTKPVQHISSWAIFPVEMPRATWRTGTSMASPVPAFRSILEGAVSRAHGSEVVLLSDKEMADMKVWSWWRRGRVEAHLKHGAGALLVIGWARARVTVPALI